MLKIYLMKLNINKFKFFAVCPVFFLCLACTNTPWHKQQAELFLNKGISLIELKQYNNALKELLEAEKYNSSDHRIHYNMGIAYLGKDMKGKAIKEFQEAISLKDDYSEAHNYLGILYLDKGLADKAIEEFDKALANPLYDTPVMPLYNAGLAYYSKKDYSKALTKFHEALQKNPETVYQPQIEKNIGLIYFDQSNIEEAVQHFTKSIELNPNLYDAQFLLGECYLKIKNTEKAKKVFQNVIKLSPQSSFGQRAKNYLQLLQ
jgi:tetratricopeptide (TPR) repeat protein